jgi:hypothetical protein
LPPEPRNGGGAPPAPHSPSPIHRPIKPKKKRTRRRKKKQKKRKKRREVILVHRRGKISVDEEKN